SEDILGAATQRDTRNYYPKTYWEIFPNEILGDTTQRDIGRYYPKRFWESLPEDILGVTTLRDTSIIRTPFVCKREVVGDGLKWGARDDKEKLWYELARLETSFDVLLGPCDAAAKKGKEGVECVGPVAYRLKLPHKLSCINDTFHVSNLKKCLAESDVQVPLEEIEIDENLSFVEEPIKIVNETLGRASVKKEGRTVYYTVLDDDRNVDDDAYEEKSFAFNGRNMYDLTQDLEDQTGLEDIIICSRNPLNGKLIPLRLALPPNNAAMHVVVVDFSY
ncbi:hypothetical protein Tco_0944645, partial [Tanacetum coccineum]